MTWAFSPTCSRMREIACAMKSLMTQCCRALQISTAKFFSISEPRGVCETSGWNWIPVKAKVRFSSNGHKR